MFDKEAVQKELDLQRELSQDFSKNLQAANTEINQHLDKLKADKEAGKISEQEYNKKLENWQRGKVLLNMISAGLSEPTQSTTGIVAATASPALSYEIGQQFKKYNAEGTPAHILAHAILGAAVAAAGDNNALAGALSAGGAEAAAPYISKWLYGKDKGSDLTAEEKETVTAITNLLGTATGVAVGNSVTDAAQGSLNAQSAVENNNGALKAIDKAKCIIIPAFGALYCSLDKQCTSVTGTFMGILDDLLEENKRIEEENQRQLEQLKALYGESWILSSNNSNKGQSSTVNQSQNSTVQAATGSPQIEPPDDENRSNIRATHNSIKESPNYPNGFRDVQNGTRKVTIKNQSVLDNLRKVERGEWKKVYRDGFDGNGNKVSIYYFQNSRTGRVFNVKVKNYWSN